MTETVTDQTRPITIEDVKHRAEAVKDLVVSDTKQVVASVVEAPESKKLLVAVGAVVLVAGLAYYLGTRASRRVYGDPI